MSKSKEVNAGKARVLRQMIRTAGRPIQWPIGKGMTIPIDEVVGGTNGVFVRLAIATRGPQGEKKTRPRQTWVRLDKEALEGIGGS